ncbi:MAG: 3-phosphoshikimate 1-carboxyvinyltransferase [Euryarchaeota archaeon]|nr:3-phosphoshikimate 1-carboxyvinyltransferase [Euryarchaeota archaeon]
MDVDLERVENVDLCFSAPPSKSYTHRALIIAALGNGVSSIVGVLSSDDISVTCRVLRSLGVSVEEDEDKSEIRIAGCNGKFPCTGEVVLDCGDSGTTLRLITSAAALSDASVLITGSGRMKERPAGPLVDALRTLGCGIKYCNEDGYPPFMVEGPLNGGETSLDASVSSQFVSSLLIAAPYAKEQVGIAVEGEAVSQSYLDITLDVMRKFGVHVVNSGYRHFSVSPGGYSGREYRIEGDYSSASYLFAIAAVCGGRVVVDNLNPESVQGDLQFLSALEAMGCLVTYYADSVEVVRDRVLRGIEIDMSSSPDTVQTLCSVAAFAESPTVISGIEHLRYKESDRIEAIKEMLHNCGAKTEYLDGKLFINPGGVYGCTVDPKNDHRTAMAGAILGLGAGGVRIQSAECVSKSFPGFWDILRGAGLWNE